MKPEFYVIRLGRNVDNNRPVIGNMPPPPAPARNRNQVRLNEPVNLDQGFDFEEQNPIFQNVEGFGQELLRTELRDPVIKFSSKDIAEAWAKEEVTKHPKTMYAVLQVASVFETTQPKIIEKGFNERGELFVVGDLP